MLKLRKTHSHTERQWDEGSRKLSKSELENNTRHEKTQQPKFRFDSIRGSIRSILLTTLCLSLSLQKTIAFEKLFDANNFDCKLHALDFRIDEICLQQLLYSSFAATATRLLLLFIQKKKKEEEEQTNSSKAESSKTVFAFNRKNFDVEVIYCWACAVGCTLQLQNRNAQTLHILGLATASQHISSNDCTKCTRTHTLVVDALLFANNDLKTYDSKKEKQQKKTNRQEKRDCMGEREREKLFFHYSLVDLKLI